MKIGNNTFIHATAIIYDGVEIGDNCYIGPYCVIGGPAEKVGFHESTGWVKIADNCRFEKQVTIDSGTERPTEISEGCYFLKNAHVGHDCLIGKNVTLGCNVCIGGFTVVSHDTNFGLGAVCHQRVFIPEKCMIGMNATITKSTAKTMRRFEKYIGSPAYSIGPNIRK